MAKQKKSAVPKMEFIDPNTGEIVKEHEQKPGVAYKIRLSDTFSLKSYIINYLDEKEDFVPFLYFT